MTCVGLDDSFHARNALSSALEGRDPVPPSPAGTPSGARRRHHAQEASWTHPIKPVAASIGGGPSSAGAVAALAVAAVALSPAANAATEFSATSRRSMASWSKSGGAWTVTADGSQVAQQSKADSENARCSTLDKLDDYTVQARVKPVSSGSGGFVGLLARACGSTTFYRLALLPGPGRTAGSQRQFGDRTGQLLADRRDGTGTPCRHATVQRRGAIDGTQIGRHQHCLVGRPDRAADLLLLGELRRRAGDERWHHDTAPTTARPPPQAAHEPTADHQLAPDNHAAHDTDRQPGQRERPGRLRDAQRVTAGPAPTAGPAGRP